MKNKMLAIVSVSALAATNAMAVGLDTTAAEGAIADAITKGSAIVVLGFGIAAVFLVARIIRRGMRTAG